VSLPITTAGEGGEFLQMVNYGPFDFEFAIELFEYIMAKCWSQHPAERARLREDAKANLFLPTPQEMIADQRKDLLEKVGRCSHSSSAPTLVDECYSRLGDGIGGQTRRESEGRL
jgi:hypothetical protein